MAKKKRNEDEVFIDFIQASRDELAVALDDKPNFFAFTDLTKIVQCVDLLDSFLDSVRLSR